MKADFDITFLKVLISDEVEKRVVLPEVSDNINSYIFFIK